MAVVWLLVVWSYNGDDLEIHGASSEHLPWIHTNLKELCHVLLHAVSQQESNYT